MSTRAPEPTEASVASSDDAPGRAAHRSPGAGGGRLAPPLQSHPTRDEERGIRWPDEALVPILATIATAVGMGFFITSPPALLAAGAVMTALVVLHKRRLLERRSVFALRESYDRIGLGQLAQAKRIADDVARQARAPWVLRIADVQRAIIAIRLGEMEEALGHLDRALARPLGRRERHNAAYQIEGALSMRAFVLASLGQRERARADIRAVRAAPGATNEALARTLLAEAILLERAGDRDGLRTLLERDKKLLLEGNHPRERAIVRALQRMLESSTTSVYRKAADREAAGESGEEPPLVDWVAKVAPAAAPFVRAPRSAQQAAKGALDLRSVATADAARRALVQARAAGSGARHNPTARAAWIVASATSAVVLAAIGFPALLAGELLLNRGGYVGQHGAPTAGIGWGAFAIVALLVAAIGLGAALLQRRARGGRASAEVSELARSMRLAFAGRLDEAEAALEPLRASASPLVAAQAEMNRSAIAEQRGDLEAMLAATNRGLERLLSARLVHDPTAHLLYGDLVAQRAFALAMHGRADEARAELGLLRGRAYPHAGRALFRVHLVELVRAGRFDEAARWVDEKAADLPLSVREELLADVARAVGSPESAGAGEMERLRRELREPAQRAWLEAAAPGLVEAFRGACEGEGDDRAPARLRVAIPEDGAPLEGPGEKEAAEAAKAARDAEHAGNPESADEDAEEEAHATEEVAAAPRAPARLWRT